MIIFIYSIPYILFFNVNWHFKTKSFVSKYNKQKKTKQEHPILIEITVIICNNCSKIIAKPLCNNCKTLILFHSFINIKLLGLANKQYF